MNIKTTTLFICFILFSFFLSGQSFEGVVTYKVSFDLLPIKNQKIKPTQNELQRRLQIMGEENHVRILWLKDGNYLECTNDCNSRKSIYIEEDSKIYSFNTKGEVIIKSSTHWSMLDKSSSPDKFIIEELDSVKRICGIDCKLLKITANDLEVEQFYWYNKNQIPILISHYENHQYRFFDEIFKITNSYPLEIIDIFEGVIRVATVIDINEIPVDKNLLKIPPLIPQGKEFDNSFENAYGIQLMKIKE